jgi:hypothetical protein
MGPTIGVIVGQVWVQLPHDNAVVNIVANLNTSWSHINCFHLRNLNVRHFWIVATTGKYGVEVMFSGMTSQLTLMKIYHFVQKLFVGDTKTDIMVIS